MIPLDLSLFGTDPWWLVLIKVVGLFVVLLVWTIFNVWYERRLVGKMQHRLGPIMNGPFGLGQALADGMKLLIKEDFRPKSADRVLFTLAPLIAGTAAFTAWAVIPFGGEVEIFGVRTRLQAHRPADLGAGHPRGGFGRHLRLRVGRLVVQFALLSAGRAALLGADDLLRAQHGSRPGGGVPVQPIDVHLRDRRGPGRTAADLRSGRWPAESGTSCCSSRPS